MKQQRSQSECLTFNLANEQYAIHLLSVQEIRTYEQPTKIANSPVHLIGVIDLRGAIVPIVDLRSLLHLPMPKDNSSVVIVVNFGDHVVGFVVDSVSDVVDIPPSTIKPSPVRISTSDIIEGVAAVEGQMVVVVDNHKLIKCSGVM